MSDYPFLLSFPQIQRKRKQNLRDHQSHNLNSVSTYLFTARFHHDFNRSGNKLCSCNSEPRRKISRQGLQVHRVAPSNIYNQIQYQFSIDTWKQSIGKRIVQSIQSSRNLCFENMSIHNKISPPSKNKK